jgi:hypothetical protein
VGEMQACDASRCDGCGWVGMGIGIGIGKV